MEMAAFRVRFKLVKRDKGNVRCDLAFSKLGLKSHAHVGLYCLKCVARSVKHGL